MKTRALTVVLLLLSATVASAQESVGNSTSTGGSGVSQGEHTLYSAVGLALAGVVSTGDHTHTANPFRFLAAVQSNQPGPLTNRIFNFDVKRGHDRATVIWESRFPGIDDTLRYRATGEEEWAFAVNASLDLDATILEAVLALEAAGIDTRDGVTAELTDALEDAGIGPLTDESLAQVISLDAQLRARRRAITATGLNPDTQYEYEAVSVAIQGQRSVVHEGFFRTRAAPDLRPVVGTDLDIQTTSGTGASV